MPLSWSEIKSHAIAFSKEWENNEREEAAFSLLVMNNYPKTIYVL